MAGLVTDDPCDALQDVVSSISFNFADALGSVNATVSPVADHVLDVDNQPDGADGCLRTAEDIRMDEDEPVRQSPAENEFAIAEAPRTRTGMVVEEEEGRRE